MPCVHCDPGERWTTADRWSVGWPQRQAVMEGPWVHKGQSLGKVAGSERGYDTETGNADARCGRVD